MKEETHFFFYLFQPYSEKISASKPCFIFNYYIIINMIKTYVIHMKRNYQINKEGNMQSLLIKFPTKIIQKMDDIVQSGASGYGSRSEFIRYCVRRTIGENRK